LKKSEITFSLGGLGIGHHAVGAKPKKNGGTKTLRRKKGTIVVGTEVAAHVTASKKKIITTGQEEKENQTKG